MSVRQASGSEDVPLAEVKNLGPSEIASFLVILGSFLMLLFGDDFGLRERAQEFAAIAIGMATVGTSIARALKHVGVANANATVIAAQSAQLLQLPDATEIDLEDIELDGYDDDPDEPPAGVVLDADDEDGTPTPVVRSRRSPH